MARTLEEAIQLACTNLYTDDMNKYGEPTIYMESHAESYSE